MQINHIKYAYAKFVASKHNNGMKNMYITSI